MHIIRWCIHSNLPEISTKCAEFVSFHLLSAEVFRAASCEGFSVQDFFTGLVL